MVDLVETAEEYRLFAYSKGGGIKSCVNEVMKDTTTKSRFLEDSMDKVNGYFYMMEEIGWE